jgi:hypothetical protein
MCESRQFSVLKLVEGNRNYNVDSLYELEMKGNGFSSRASRNNVAS